MPSAAFAVLLLAAHGGSIGLATVRFTTTSTADTFCRASAATRTYGSAGALCVAGVNSVNGSGAARGRFDTMVKFSTAGAKSAFDTAYGIGRWRVAQVNLTVNEDDSPSNATFPRGDGDFELLWFSNDNWQEGSGTPNSPGTGTGTQLTWTYLNAIAPSAQQESLGRFANAGAPETQTFALTPSPGLLADIGAQATVSIRFAPIRATLGFVFHSHNYPNPDWRPMLEIVAEPIVPGDLNCDNRFDNFDIDPFVMAIVDPGTYSSEFPDCHVLLGDFNRDGVFDNFDIDPFVACLVEGCS